MRLQSAPRQRVKSARADGMGVYIRGGDVEAAELREPAERHLRRRHRRLAAGGGGLGDGDAGPVGEDVGRRFGEGRVGHEGEVLAA